MDPGFSPTERCLIGVSGGRDSVMLLHRLVAAGFKDLIVCHLDHALRAESADDARFVGDLAKQHGLECLIERRDVAACAKRRRQSVETAARDARYALFSRIAQRHACPRLFLAHHADDQVETFLFNLFRGSAAAGLAGMRPMTTRTIDGLPLQISRPLLSIWREEIDAYVARHNLAFREDVSNSDSRHTRNRFRHEIIPALESTFGREIRRTIWRSAEILRTEDDFLSTLLDLDVCAAQLSVPEVSARPLALQRRILHAWLKHHHIPNVGFSEVEAVRKLLSSRTAKTNLPGNWHARRRAKALFLEPPRTSGLSD